MIECLEFAGLHGHRFAVVVTRDDLNLEDKWRLVAECNTLQSATKQVAGYEAEGWRARVWEQQKPRTWRIRFDTATAEPVELYVFRMLNKDGKRAWRVCTCLGQHSVWSMPKESQSTIIQRWMDTFPQFAVSKVTRFKGLHRPSEFAMTIAERKMKDAD